MELSFYSPLWHNNKMLYGAAAMNVRLAQLGGADVYSHNIAAQAVQNALSGLMQAPTFTQHANNSNVVPLKRPRKSA